jgi:HEAT repeat protein
VWCVTGLPIRAGESSPDKEALRYDGKPFGYWRDYLRTELKAERRIEGIRAMAAFGTKGYAVSASRAILGVVDDYGGNPCDGGSPDGKVVWEAAQGAQKIGSVFFDVLLENIKRPRLRRFAVELLVGPQAGSDFPLSGSALQILIRKVQVKDADVRSFAVAVLGSAIAEEKTKKRVVKAVVRRSQTDAVVRGLIQSLEDDTKPVAFRIAPATAMLAALGTSSNGAIPTLVKVHLRFPNDWGKYQETLHCVGANSRILVPLITAALKDQKARIRINALMWLGELGPSARDALPALKKAMKDSDPEVQKAAWLARYYVTQDKVESDKALSLPQKPRS